MIAEWFEKGCPYQEGVDIYEKKGGDKTFVRLMRQGERPFLVKKLEEELSKIQKLEKPTELPSAEVQKMDKKGVSHYPLELHEVFLQRKRTYFESDILKVKLNNLPPEAVQEALKIQLEIYRLRKENKKCWEILDYYDTTGRVMEYKTEKVYNLSVDEAWKRRQLHYQNISKRERTIDKLIEDLEKITDDDPNRLRIELKLAKKKEEVQQLKNEVESLSKLINSKV